MRDDECRLDGRRGCPHAAQCSKCSNVRECGVGTDMITLHCSCLKRALTGGGGNLRGLAQALEQHAQKLGLKQESKVDWVSQ